MKKPQIITPQQYYNTIAEVYNDQLSNENDNIVRTEIADFFKSVVKKGAVLDFGGGTGLDLPWLLDAGFEVYFCEPAEKMKRNAEILAKEHVKGDHCHFLLDEMTDFQVWNTSNTSFRLDGILANFGVLNYIDDLPALFDRFSLILNQNGSIVANMLYASPASLLSRHLLNSIKALVKGQKIKLASRYKDVIHETTLYSIKAIRKAAEKDFILKVHKPLGNNSDFLLIHLQKKN